MQDRLPPRQGPRMLVLWVHGAAAAGLQGSLDEVLDLRAAVAREAEEAFAV